MGALLVKIAHLFGVLGIVVVSYINPWWMYNHTLAKVILTMVTIESGSPSVDGIMKDHGLIACG